MEQKRKNKKTCEGEASSSITMLVEDNESQWPSLNSKPGKRRKISCASDEEGLEASGREDLVHFDNGKLPHDLSFTGTDEKRVNLTASKKARYSSDASGSGLDEIHEIKWSEQNEKVN